MKTKVSLIVLINLICGLFYVAIWHEWFPFHLKVMFSCVVLSLEVVLTILEAMK